MFHHANGVWWSEGKKFWLPFGQEWPREIRHRVRPRHLLLPQQFDLNLFIQLQNRKEMHATSQSTLPSGSMPWDRIFRWMVCLIVVTFCCLSFSSSSLSRKMLRSAICRIQEQPLRLHRLFQFQQLIHCASQNFVTMQCSVLLLT